MAQVLVFAVAAQISRVVLPHTSVETSARAGPLCEGSDSTANWRKGDTLCRLEADAPGSPLYMSLEPRFTLLPGVFDDVHSPAEEDLRVFDDDQDPAEEDLRGFMVLRLRVLVPPCDTNHCRRYPLTLASIVACPPAVFWISAWIATRSAWSVA